MKRKQWAKNTAREDSEYERLKEGQHGWHAEDEDKAVQTEPGDVCKDQTLQDLINMEGFLSLFKCVKPMKLEVRG